jgi:hypothetical protein
MSTKEQTMWSGKKLFAVIGAVMVAAVVIGLVFFTPFVMK